MQFCTVMKNTLVSVTKNWWLLYDNDPRHKAQVPIQWLNENLVRRRIDFPPYSPDLNPIENLWAYLVPRVDKHFAKTEEQLKKAIQAEWTKIPEDFVIYRIRYNTLCHFRMNELLYLEFS